MLIIIPGWMHQASDWDAVAKVFEREKFDFGVLDVPGFGNKPFSSEINTLSALTRWCKDEIDSLQTSSTTPLVLLGHSCGGRVALKLVAEGLEVERLILCSSPNLYRPSFRTKIKKLVTFLGAPVKPLVPEVIKQKLRSDDFRVARGTEMEDLYSDVVRDDQTHLLGKLKTATSLIWGEDDDAAPIWIARELSVKLKNADLQIIPKVSHNLHKEKPELLAARIIKLCRSEN